MSDFSTNRSGVQPGTKRHDSTTTSSEPHEGASKPAGTPTAANERLQKELLEKLPDSSDNAQERGERLDNAKAIATSGKSAPAKPK